MAVNFTFYHRIGMVWDKKFTGAKGQLHYPVGEKKLLGRCTASFNVGDLQNGSSTGMGRTWKEMKQDFFFLKYGLGLVQDRIFFFCGSGMGQD